MSLGYLRCYAVSMLAPPRSAALATSFVPMFLLGVARAVVSRCSRYADAADTVPAVSKMRWDKAAREQRVHERGGEPLERLIPPPRKAPGIRNEQASELAALQKRLGERYSGSGMTAAEADRAIRAA